MSGILLAAINAKWIHPSLALRLLKANLGNLEDRCEIMEFALRQPLAEKLEPILAARPLILGLSVSIWNHSATLELLKALNEKWNMYRSPDQNSMVQPKPIVVLGGPEVSWLSRDSMIFTYADYVIQGEGEESFRSLCVHLLEESLCASLESAKTNDNKSAVFINCTETAVNVDSSASPYRLYTDEDLKKKLVYVEASRGCPFACDFCLGPARSEGKGISVPVREFPLPPFLTDMGKLIDRGGRQFKFLDRTFNLKVERAEKIMNFFLSRIMAQDTAGAEKGPLCVHFEMFPSPLHPVLKDMLRRFPAGSLRLELGIQTFNPETSSLVHRSGDPLSAVKQTEDAIKTLEFLRRETNAIIHADLIAGLPGEGLSSFGAGFDLLWRVLSGTGNLKLGSLQTGACDRFEIQLGILKCLPGTPIARYNKTFGMKFSAEPPYEVLETAALGFVELNQIKNFARFWEIIVNRSHFTELVTRFIPPGEPVFERFMDLSKALAVKFGRNWGINRHDLENSILEHFLPEKQE